MTFTSFDFKKNMDRKQIFTLASETRVAQLSLFPQSDPIYVQFRKKGRRGGGVKFIYGLKIHSWKRALAKIISLPLLKFMIMPNAVEGSRD